MINQSVFQKMKNNQIPEYYDGMYLDGYKPYQIMEAVHNSIIQRYTEAQQQEASADEAPMDVRLKVEVKRV